MNEKSRTLNTIVNSISGIVVQIISVLLNFIVRLVFVRYLNEEFLGINGLFSNILTVLSLTELGVGTAIIYNLYKPVADKNEFEIAALMNFYRKAYNVIGCVITILGVSITPFLNCLIKDTPNISNLLTIYLLFLINTVCSYFFSYKRSVFIADQREALLSKYKLYFSVLKTIGQCLILITTRDFVLYLIAQILSTFGENLYVSFRTDKIYPFLRKYKKVQMSKEKIKEIAINIKALMIYKLGSTMLDGTDNIILSACVGVGSVGLLSNYTLIVGAVSMIVSQITSALTASVGNFIAKEEVSKHEELLKRITFISYLFYGFAFSCLTCLLNPFVELFFGINYVLEFKEVFVIALNFYIFGMMGSIWTFRTTMGLFVHGKYRPLVSAIMNIIISILLAKHMGLLGVLVGTTVTRLTTNVWFDPHIVYKYGLKKGAISYYLNWVRYLVISLITIFINQSVLYLLPKGGFGMLFIRCMLCVGITVFIMLWCLSNMSEFKYIKQVIFGKILKKRKSTEKNNYDK